LTGGGGVDYFYFAFGYGEDKVRDFESGTDKIYLSTSLGVFTGTQAMAFASSSNGDIIFNFGQGNILILENVEPNQISAFDIIF
jgi:Ca2+-binding RTX toxin-like protein